MEQFCHRCGAAVPESSAFCNQCGAPQVRIPEALTAPTTSEASGSAGTDVPQAIDPSALNWRHALPSASTAGLVMAIASLLPVISTFFPIWMLGGGWLAVTLYRRRSTLLLMTSSAGGKLGALAGLLGFVFFALFTSALLAIQTVILHHGDQLRAMLRSVLDQAASSNHDPRAQAVAQWMQTPEGLALVVTLSLALFLIAFLLLSTAGGIFAASAARRRLRS